MSLGWASLKLAEGVAVPDAIGLTGELSAVAGAQPNYVYTLDEEDAGDSGGLQVGSIMGAPDPDLAYQGGESYSTYDYSAFVDDPIADNQMVLLAVCAREAYQYTHDAQHKPKLWEEASARPSIAIIDTGVQASHEDLAANMVKSYDAVNKVERESYIGSHGTHVAGIAAVESLDPTTAGFDAYTGFGAVDAFDAVVAADTHTYITGPTLMAVGNAGTMRVPESAHASSVVWSSLDPGVISIDAQTGAVHALKSGPAIIRALCVVPALPALTAGESEPVAGGTADETRTVELYTIVTVFDAKIKGPDSVQYGQTITLGLDASPASGTWEWSSDNDSVTVGKWGDDGTGNVTVAGKKKGAATITATLTSNRAIKVTKRVTVTAADISKANVTLVQTSYEYDGKAKTPAVTVKLGSTALRNEADYTVEYANNVVAGQGRVTIRGKGNYTGTVIKTFQILQSPTQRMHRVQYRTHVQNVGWMGWARNGAQAGTAGYAYRLEAIQVKLVPKGGAAPGPTAGAFRQS